MKKLLLILAIALVSGPLMAVECPEGAPSCKVVTITPEELKTLTDLIFPAATWANRAQATDLVKAWENKISAAPAGEVRSATLPAPPAGGGKK